MTVLQGLSRRLGFTPGHLNMQDVDAMYVACIFGQAWQPEEWSPWCSVFTQGLIFHQIDIKPILSFAI